MEDNKIDINSLIGLFLLGFIFIVWLWLNPPPEQEIIISDENIEEQIQEDKAIDTELSEIIENEIDLSNENIDLFIFDSLQSNNQLKIIETDKFKISFSSKGGQIRSLELKENYNYLSKPVNLVKNGNSIFNFSFLGKNGVQYNTNDLNFDFFVQNVDDSKIILMKSNVNENTFVEYKYTIDDGYIIDFDFRSEGFKKLVNSDQPYSFEWELNAFRNSKSISYENRYTYLTYFHDNDNIDYLSISGEDEDEENNLNWISYKQHFFSSVLIPKEEQVFEKAIFNSEDLVNDTSIDTLFTKKFLTTIPFKYVNNEFDNSFRFYFGPNEYSTLKSYEIDLEESIDFGWGIFGFINKNIFVPLYKYLSNLFPYGIAIIFMTIIVRIALAPVLYKSYLSQAKMKILKPELNEINAKFKDNAMKRQQEMMSLYRKAGANPMSGCLPGLLQIPVFYALFMFFPSAFDLRQKSFLWADDLSAYDSIIDFGFYIPLYGDHVSLFPILAAISIFFYMKMTTGQQMASQPKPQDGMPDMAKMMKYMIYFAPIMMMVFFNNYSSGLSLYYFISNLLSIAIMFTIKNYILDEQKIRQQIQFNKSQPNKPPSRFQRRMQAIMEEAERQKKNKK
jgi:YidC/Oxa1 family membrane protein insertase